MPRMPRRDAPGALHHVTLRGVAQSDVFVDDLDRGFLYDRMAKVVSESSASVLAFAFMDNHVHALVRTGPVALGTIMARIATAYAMHFNRRHRRTGHLFQNRYHSALVESDAHALNSVRYVHTNPLAARMLETLDQLESYPWTGHPELAGARRAALVDVRASLSLFGDGVGPARMALREFMQGWAQPEPTQPPRTLAPLALCELELALARVARAHGLAVSDLTQGSRRRAVCRAREVVARDALARGLRASEVALRLGLTHAALLRAAKRSHSP